MRLFFAFLLLTAAALPGRAQDSTYTLPALLVTAPRGVEQASATGRTILLGAREIEQTGAASVADLLARRGGLFVRPYGPGGLASLSLRGTGAAQTLVLLDGFRLADPQLGQVDLSLLPTALLARADILHGAASAWHGTDALGGVLSLTSRAPGGGTRASAEAEAGAYGLLGGSLLAETGVATGSALVSVTHRQSSGDYLVESAALGRTPRRNADFTQTGLLATAARGRTRAGIWLTRADRGLPGVAGTPPQGERQHDQSARLWVRTTRPLSTGTLTGGIAVQAGALRYTHPLLGIDDTGRTAVLMAEAEARQAVGQHWLVGSGVSYSFSGAAHPSLADAAREHRGSVFSYAEGTHGRFYTALALRFDAYAQPGGMRQALSPRLGFGFMLTPHLRAMLSGARSFRVPTFNDRFWQPGGKPDLRPEHGIMLEGGLRWHRGALSAEATAYQHHVRDQIIWMPGARGVWSPANIGKVRTRGLELSAEVTASRLSLHPYGGVFYTLTDARDISDPAAPAYNQPLRYVPHESARFYAGGALGLLTLDAGLRYTGKRFVRTDGEDALDPIIVADVQARLHHPVPGGRLHAAIVVENVFDTRYSVLQGYPMPPRHLRLRLRYVWE